MSGCPLVRIDLSQRVVRRGVGRELLARGLEEALLRLVGSQRTHDHLDRQVGMGRGGGRPGPFRHSRRMARMCSCLAADHGGAPHVVAEVEHGSGLAPGQAGGDRERDRREPCPATSLRQPLRGYRPSRSRPHKTVMPPNRPTRMPKRQGRSELTSESIHFDGPKPGRLGRQDSPSPSLWRAATTQATAWASPLDLSGSYGA